MTMRDDYLRHQQTRWIRPDAARWVRADAARFLKPGADLKAAFPALQQKYSASQPRVPAGNGRESGRWGSHTQGNVGGGGSAAPSPMGDIDFGDLSELGDLGDLFQIASSLFDDTDFTQLAGDPPSSDTPGIGHNQGPPLEPPEIPTEWPYISADRMKVVWGLARWVAKVRSILPVVDVVSALIEQAQWFNARQADVLTYSDPARTLEELQARATLPKESGYENHHIEEQSLLGRLGYPDPYIDHPSNIVRIPTLKHYDVSGWYGTANSKFGGLSPRDYLRTQPRDVRRQVGLDTLIDLGVLER